MHSTLCCRIVLNLRTAAAKEDEIRYRFAQSARDVSRLRFNTWETRWESMSEDDSTDSRRAALNT